MEAHRVRSVLDLEPGRVRPAWMKRVQDDEIRMLMRASAAVAAPAVATMKTAEERKSKLRDLEPFLRVVDPRLADFAGPESAAMSGTYMSSFTTRPLATLVPRPPEPGVAPVERPAPLLRPSDVFRVRPRKKRPGEDDAPAKDLDALEVKTLEEMFLKNDGPLTRVRNLLLRNANEEDRRPVPQHYNPALHGSTAEVPAHAPPVFESLRDGKATVFAASARPGHSASATTSPQPRGRRYDPAQEHGVQATDATLPPPMRPLSAMKRFTLFTLAHDEEPEPPPAAHAFALSRTDERSVLLDGQAAAPQRYGRGAGRASNEVRAPVYSMVRYDPASGGGRRAGGGGGSLLAAGAASGVDVGARDAEDAVSIDDSGLSISASERGPTAEATAATVGAVGVSHANKRGEVGGLFTHAPRRGTGIIRGTVVVPYTRLPEATLESKRWGTTEAIEYRDDQARIPLILMPPYFEPFMLALERATGGEAKFYPEMNPPLFVADIGGLPGHAARVIAADGGATVVSGFDDPSVLSLVSSAAGTEKASSVATGGGRAGEGGAPAGGGGSTLTGPSGRSKARAAWAPSEADVERHKMTEATRETQEILDRYVLSLADRGRETDLLSLINNGVPVEVDEHPWFEKSSPQYPAKRVAELLKNDRDRQRKSPAAAAKVPRVFPNLEATDEKGHTALMLAARHGEADTVAVLLENGAPRHKKTIKGQDALAFAKAESGAASLALKMKAPGALERKRRAIKVVQMLDDRSILAAARDGDLRRVRALLNIDEGGVAVTNPYGMTALHFAVINKDVEMTELLAELGADVHKKNNVGQAPLAMVQDLGGDRLAVAMMEALDRGRKAFAERASKAAKVEEHRKAMAAHGEQLKKEMRTATRGTTAAKAMFPLLASVPGEGVTASASRVATRRAEELARAMHSPSKADFSLPEEALSRHTRRFVELKAKEAEQTLLHRKGHGFLVPGEDTGPPPRLAVREVLRDPEGATAKALADTEVPDPSSAAFEAWCRLRFGVIPP